MKIIAGDRKGHNLIAPKGQETRPTLNRVRESLFSIISGDIPDSTFCELFAGAGSIGLEALSRGAAKAVFVEIAREPYQCLKENIKRLRYLDQARAVQADALRWEIPTGDAAPDIIFADPPYEMKVIDKLLQRLDAANLKSDTLIILQTSAHYKINSGFRLLRTAKYGTTALHFFLPDQPKAEAESAQSATDSN